MTKNTNSGQVFEDLIEAALQPWAAINNFSIESQVIVGTTPNGSKHIVDLELIDNFNSDHRGLVSCKFQSQKGTTDEKIAYEVIKLVYAIEQDSRYKHAWLVLGGSGWSEGVQTFVRHELVKWIPKMSGLVTVHIGTGEIVTKGIALPPVTSLQTNWDLDELYIPAFITQRNSH
jgi:hypothetical protein